MPGENGAVPVSRRRLLRAVFTLGTLAGTAAALSPIVGAGHGTRGGAAPPRPGPPTGAAASADEVYRGRHIQVRVAEVAAGTAAEVSSAARQSPAPSLDIRIDGRPLHVMRRADGGYLSVVNHYESFPTPVEAARAAVDDLGDAQLSLSGPIHHV